MMNRLAIVVFVVLLATAARAADAPTADDLVLPPTAAELSPETFDHWRQYLRPTEEEMRWTEIPWRASFWQGVIDAQEQRKPVLLWVMNGHPMGCT